jgi:hypothetical protein
MPLPTSITTRHDFRTTGSTLLDGERCSLVNGHIELHLAHAEQINCVLRTTVQNDSPSGARGCRHELTIFVHSKPRTLNMCAQEFKARMCNEVVILSTREAPLLAWNRPMLRSRLRASHWLVH